MTSIAARPAPQGADASTAASYEEDLLIVQILRAIPVIGWFVSDALDGQPDAKYYFIFNLVVLLAVALAVFGYAALILLALAATAISMVLILVITLG